MIWRDSEQSKLVLYPDKPVGRPGKCLLDRSEDCAARFGIIREDFVPHRYLLCGLYAVRGNYGFIMRYTNKALQLPAFEARLDPLPLLSRQGTVVDRDVLPDHREARAEELREGTGIHEDERRTALVEGV